MDIRELGSIRKEIDELDRQLANLIEKRMELVNLVAGYKKNHNIGVLDSSREKEVINNVLSQVKNPELKESISSIFQSIMDISKEYQKKKISINSGIKKYALIGEKLSHSMSPKIHELYFKKANIEATYELLELSRDEIPHVLTELSLKGYSGLNVTIPYKTEIMPFLDKLSDEAMRIGAVNTINLDGNFTGFNTDYFGFGRALSFYGAEVKGKKCAVLGSGGATRAVVSYLEDNGAELISIVSRNADEAANRYPGKPTINISEFKAEGYDIVINTTPVGMYPNTDKSPINREQLIGAGFVMDLIYNPSETLLMKYAQELGIPNCNGLYMLVAQAMSSQEIWQGKKIDDEIINQIYREISHEN
ncbi:MAG: shikimate dehydrogenase [Clostridiaceae bacterium]|nr:shikimate dehydrogenase [Clostridiaceae bacterium]